MRVLMFLAAIPISGALLAAGGPGGVPVRTAPLAKSVPVVKKDCPSRAHVAREPLRAPLFRPQDPVSFDLHLAVWRTVDGCPVPAILRRDVDDAERGPARADEGSTFVRPL